MFIVICNLKARRDFTNNLAEHRSILRNYQNTYFLRFSFTPKTVKIFLKHVFRFYCEAHHLIFPREKTMIIGLAVLFFKVLRANL